MQDTVASVRQLKPDLSAYLSRVKADQTVLITENSKPIGQIMPITESVEERLERRSQAGLVAWNGHTLAPLAPPSRARGPYTVADLLLEDRE